MKTKRTELDVDFIGSQPSKLTKEEEEMISDFIKADKQRRKTLKVSKKGMYTQ